jgi:hypothetical protein
MIVLARSELSLSAELATARKTAKAQVDAAVGKVRLAYITDTPGQALIYAAKEAEAAAFLALPEAPETLEQFPFIAAEVGTSSGGTPDEIAQLYLNLAAIWETVGAQLEAARIGAKDAIDAAPDRPAIAAAVEALEATLAPFRIE